MQFQVPQFIDLQPKIVGPLTLRQFIYIAGAVIPIFILYFQLQFWLWLILASVLGLSAAALAFLKYNGQPLIKILTAAFNYFWQPRFYLWKRAEKPLALPELPKLPEQKIPKRDPLKDLFLKLTTTTHPIAKREKTVKFLREFKVPKEDFETIRRTTGERRAARRVDFR
jgi:hypothetical protein